MSVLIMLWAKPDYACSRESALPIATMGTSSPLIMEVFMAQADVEQESTANATWSRMLQAIADSPKASRTIHGKTRKPARRC